MLAVLTDDQESLADTVASMKGVVGVQNPQDLDEFDHEKAWSTLASTDLLTLRVRENGIPLASGVETMIVAHGLGAALSPTPYLSGALAVELLEAAAAPADLIESVSAGVDQPALLLRPDLVTLADVSELGTAVALGGHRSDYAFALRAHGGGSSLVRVELTDTFALSDAADLTAHVRRPAADAQFATAEIGSPISEEALQRWTALALTLVAADCAGAMRAALDGVVEYSKQRIAYGHPIGSYQALQHMAADAYAACEAAVTTNNYAAWGVDVLDPLEALLAARTAKAWVASTGLGVTETVMQMYGGIGQTWEHIAHVFNRRVLMDTVLFGGEQHQLDEIFALLQKVD